MKTSEKLGLNIPDYDEFADIEALAENFEKIDEKFGKLVSTEPNQGLTEEEKANARSNIGAGESGFSGDYSDLKNIPDEFNPTTHTHTSKEVGLGNVPNVETNDQKPTYTEASSLSELTSGEKISVAFGKIKKAISSLISHLEDTISHITSEERSRWNWGNHTSVSRYHSYDTDTELYKIANIKTTSLNSEVTPGVDIEIPSEYLVTSKEKELWNRKTAVSVTRHYLGEGTKLATIGLTHTGDNEEHKIEIWAPNSPETDVATTTKNGLMSSSDKIKLDNTPSENYKKSIDKKIYSTLGRTLGIRAGYLRKYNIPKKIVCLGNSITMHGYYEADGISWTVSDNRAMAASRPNSDWVSLVQQYITSEINSDCKVYKTNISVWETGTLGSREYSSISDTSIVEVKSDKAYSTSYTVDTILDEDTDVVVIQLSENMVSPSNSSEKAQMLRDFCYLFANIRSRCPNATVYCLCGFIFDVAKTHCMVQACKYQDVIPIQALTLIDTWDTQYDSISIKCSAGDPIYDGDGNTIATVSNKAAGHPNDTGFQVIATYVLNALFNDISFENTQRKILFSRNSTTTLPNATGGFFNCEVDLTGKYDIKAFDDYYDAYLDYLIIPGQYPFTAKDITGNAAEGYLEVKTFTEIKNQIYQSLIQTWNVTNACKSTKISRRTVLSADDIIWGKMYIEGGTHTPWSYSVVNGISDTTGISVQCSDNVAIISLNMVPSITGDDQTWIKFLKVDYKPIIETYSSASFYPTQEKNTSIKIDTDGYVWIFNSNRLGTNTNLLDYVSGQLVYVYNNEI